MRIFLLDLWIVVKHIGAKLLSQKLTLPLFDLDRRIAEEENMPYQ